MTTISRTFSKVPKLNSCATTPNRRLASGKFLSISMPKILALPEVLFTKDPIMPIVEDLPAPFGPSNAKKSPSSTFRSIPFRATTSLLYTFLRFDISNA